MGILDNAVRSAVPGGSVAKPLMIALLGLLASGALFKGGGGQSTAAKPPQNPADEAGGLLGGLGGLLERFQQGPHGNLLNSWIGTGENQSISPNQLGTALGPDVIKVLAQRSGLSEAELTSQLSKALPGVVDKLTGNAESSANVEIRPLAPQRSDRRGISA